MRFWCDHGILFRTCQFGGPHGKKALCVAGVILARDPHGIYDFILLSQKLFDTIAVHPYILSLDQGSEANIKQLSSHPHSDINSIKIEVGRKGRVYMTLLVEARNTAKYGQYRATCGSRSGPVFVKPLVQC